MAAFQLCVGMILAMSVAGCPATQANLAVVQVAGLPRPSTTCEWSAGRFTWTCDDKPRAVRVPSDRRDIYGVVTTRLKGVAQAGGGGVELIVSAPEGLRAIPVPFLPTNEHPHLAVDEPIGIPAGPLVVLRRGGAEVNVFLDAELLAESIEVARFRELLARTPKAQGASALVIAADGCEPWARVAPTVAEIYKAVEAVNPREKIALAEPIMSFDNCPSNTSPTE